MTSLRKPYIYLNIPQTLLAFEAWKEQHGILYGDVMEEERRLQAFEETLKMVKDHNNDQGNREGGYMLELNRFADMTW